MRHPHGSGERAVEIREIDAAQFEELGRLTVEAYRQVSGFEPGAGYLAELGDVARRAALAVVLVAIGSDGRLLGGVTYVPGPGPYFEWDATGSQDSAGPSGPQDSAGLRMLAVAPEARRCGVGTALVRACLARARAEGRARIWLHTTPEMTEAHRIYEREGFARAPQADWTGRIRLWAYVLDVRRPPTP